MILSQLRIGARSTTYAALFITIIMPTWLMVEVPGKSGLPRSISARMQPRLHMSTPIVYRFEASRISGALEMVLSGIR